MKQRSRAIHRIGSIVVVVILLLQLFGCASSWSFITEDDYSKKTVKIDGKLYRAGFYSNDLWPKIEEHPVDGIKVGRVTYYPLSSGAEWIRVSARSPYKWNHKRAGVLSRFPVGGSKGLL